MFNIRKIPKVLLHVHLEGTLTANMIFNLSKKNNLLLKYKDVSELKQEFDKLSNLEDFLKLYYEGSNVLCTKEDFFYISYEYMLICKENNVKHVEPFFDPQCHIMRGIEFSDIVDGIHEGLTKGKNDFGITFKLIMCIVRDLPLESAYEVLEKALNYKDKITGIGLDSNEIGNSPIKFKDIFKIAKQNGFKLCCHGGHDGDVDPYVTELLELELDRIDHGIKCIDDEKVMNKIKEMKIPLTVCPISNVKVIKK
jgi:adenine deaminase